MSRFASSLAASAIVAGAGAVPTPPGDSIPGFAIVSYSIDAGGGSSSDAGSVFELHGAIGQHDAVTSAAGGFELRGGFYPTPANAPCPGDTNGDRVVDFFDLNNVLTDFGQVGPSLVGDLDHDGDCDFFDLNILLSNFNQVC